MSLGAVSEEPSLGRYKILNVSAISAAAGQSFEDKRKEGSRNLESYGIEIQCKPQVILKQRRLIGVAARLPGIQAKMFIGEPCG